ncbi:MAG: hypothetical protein QOG34_2300 [Frankiaceae bacterium]|nr:hypothetical protein [Frankiaceae bacterium]
MDEDLVAQLEHAEDLLTDYLRQMGVHRGHPAKMVEARLAAKQAMSAVSGQG